MTACKWHVPVDTHKWDWRECGREAGREMGRVKEELKGMGMQN